VRPLWVLLVATLVLLVVLAVGGATSVFYIHFPQRLEAELEGEFLGDVERLREELRAIDDELDSLLDRATARADAKTTVRMTPPWLWARELLLSPEAQLKVLAEDGSVLSSGHWPASLGALDPGLSDYLASPSGSSLREEPLPFGSAVALQRWRRGSWHGQDAIFVAGLGLGGAALEKLRVLQRVDLLILEDRHSGLREVAAAADLALPHDLSVATVDSLDALLLRSHVLPIPGSSAVLLIGRGRAEILAAQRGIRQVLILVGGASSLIALLLGLLLARNLANPVEALAETAGRLARGDLDARVAPGKSRVLEVERLVEAFNQMADEIQQSQTQLVQAERVAAWREIARGLAHELKNPLTPILGAMDVIRKARSLDRDDFDEILDEQARAVVEEVMRLKELADEFARFARLPDPKPEPLNLPELLDSAVALYSSVDDTLRIVRDYAPSTPIIEADRSQLQTVITNLVKNALEAMGSSGTLVLALAPTELGDGRAGVELRIGDSGPGVPEDVRDKLFTPYFTTKGSRGTGLGLALSHRILIEHGGSISVGTSTEGGAEFTLRLPLRPPPTLPPRS
jgi:signal transduction histidine kinase